MAGADPFPTAHPPLTQLIGPTLVAVQARNLTRATVLATDVEMSLSFWGRFMGLMGRAPLPSGHGMWIPGNGIHMFFMRFAIDAVFLGKREADGSRPILGLYRALAPWVGLVPLVRGADGVLELPVGAIAASGSELGDRVSLA